MPNPILNQSFGQDMQSIASEPMTINGTISKTIVMLGCVVLTAAFVWSLYAQGFVDKVMMLMIVGLVVNVISFFVIMFNKTLLPVVAPIFALSEGLMLGGISAQFEPVYPGIVIQAIGITFMALFSMLFLYKIGVIKCTDKFRSVLLVSMVAILGIYLINFIGAFFGMQVPHLFSNGLVGIGFSLLVCVIAALNFIIDFDFIEKGAQGFLPKNMEWYGAFGLMVTLVWLYLEALRLLSKLRSR